MIQVLWLIMLSWLFIGYFGWCICMIDSSLQGCWWCYHTPTTKAQKATDRSILPTAFSTSKCKHIIFQLSTVVWFRHMIKDRPENLVFVICVWRGNCLVTYFIDHMILVTTDKWPHKDIHLFLFKKIQKSHRTTHAPLVVTIPHKHFSRVTDLYIV